MKQLILLLILLIAAFDLSAQSDMSEKTVTPDTHNMDAMSNCTAGNCCKPTVTTLKPMPPIGIMDGVGKSHFAVSTKSAEAQQFFDQGLALIQDFSSLDAYRSFKRASLLDSTCAMTYWGILFTLEGGYFSMDSTLTSERKHAAESLKHIQNNTTDEEKMLISLELKRDSLSRLYSPNKVDSLTVGDILLYINQYPDNPDMVNIYLLNFTYSPLGGYDEQRHPRPMALLGEYILQAMLAKYPNHHGLNHYYIHAVEGGPYPERALESANKLAALAPKSGHIVHMPGHVYYHTGDYEKAHAAYLASYKVDSAYLAEKKISKRDYWNYDHNLHFMIVNCAEDGRLKEGLKWAALMTDVDTVNTAYTDEKNANVPSYIEGQKRYVAKAKSSLYLRYGDWQKAYEVYHTFIPDSLIESNPYCLFLKGMAALAAKDIKTAENISDRLDAYLFRNSIDDPEKLIESYVLRMHVLSNTGKYTDALSYMQKALEEEKKLLLFNDPPLPISVAHEAGIMYRQNKEYQKSFDAFNDELKVYRLSGHAYYQLAKTCAAWGKKKEAAAYYQKLLDAWKYGDNDLPQVIEAKAWLKNNL